MLSLCLHLSSLNFCHIISAMVVILFGLDCFINFDLAYVHVPHILFYNKLELVICKLGV